MNLGTHNVLVTGATGWLGSSLLGALRLGLPDWEPWMHPAELHIRALAVRGQARPNGLGSIEWSEGDLCSRADCARFVEGARGAVLFHTAGVIHPRRVRDLYQVNLEATRQLLEEAAKVGVRRAVVVSSNSPCGCNPRPDHVFEESSPFNPYMNYGRSKMLMEQAAMEVHASGRMEVTIVRPPWFYGPNQPARQTLFFKMIRDGKMPIVGDGSNRRSMAYLDNLAQGLVLAASVPRAAGNTYWIADRSPYSMNEIVETVERLMETEFGFRCAHRRVRLPGWIGGVATVADAAIQGLGFYHQKIHVLSEMNKTIACSIAKAERELGYDPKVALEEGMRRSLRWCVDRRFLP